MEKALGLVGFTRAVRPLGSANVFGGRGPLKRLARTPWWDGATVVVGVEVSAPVRAVWARRRLAAIGEGSYGRGHVRFSEHFRHLLESQGLRSILVVRDPRDVAVSQTHYIAGHRGHPYHRHYARLGDFDEQLAFSIAGGEMPGVGYLSSLAGRYAAMEGWRDDPEVLLLRFEDLVGEAGGGSSSRQRRALGRLLDFLEPADDGAGEERVERVAGELFGGTSTFRRGTIGGWREAFAPRHLALFERSADGLLAGWGYGED